MSLLFLSGLFLCLAAAYWPAGGLFFRNDDWVYIARIQHSLERMRATNFAQYFFNDVLPDHDFIRHFHPLSLLFLFGKYAFFRVNYRLHSGVSLVLHFICALLIHTLVLRLTGSREAAALAATLFAMNGFLADTLLWAGQASFILITLLSLATLNLHPNLGQQGGVATLAFYAFNFLAPLIFEFGFFANGLSILLFLVPGPASVVGAAGLVLFVCGHLYLRHLSSGLPRHAFFVGAGQLVKNVIWGLGKICFGFAGNLPRTLVSDTLYLLGPRLGWSLAGLPLWGVVLGAGNVVKSPGSVTPYIALCLLLVACAPFVVISFAMDESNPNPDLANQMPRYMHLGAALLAVVAGFAFGMLDFPSWGLPVLLVWTVGSGFASVRAQIAMVKPHTEAMRRDVECLRQTGTLPKRGPYHGNPHNYRLDWSFTLKNVQAYLRMEQ
ncbi:MAG: hypothetical protein P4L39_10180 [Humidesulfovibrio sp.]|nr:hypothetical protein [Humidesulfovibrio sp.]